MTDICDKVHKFDDSESGVKDVALTEDSLAIDYFLSLFTEDIA